MAADSAAMAAPRAAKPRLGQRMVQMESDADDNALRLHFSKGDIALIQDARTFQRQEAHRRNLQTIKEALVPIRAPGREKTMSVKARLSAIDAMARSNAAEVKERSQVIANAAARKVTEEMCPSEERLDEEAVRIQLPLFKSPEQLKIDRLRSLPPVTGDGAIDRLEDALTKVRRRLEASGKLRGADDLAWAEQRLARSRQQAAAASAGGLGTSHASTSAAASSGGGGLLAKSASAPSSLLPKSSGGASAALRRSQRLGHAELYPSMKARLQRVEQIATKNASEISGLKADKQEILDILASG